MTTSPPSILLAESDVLVAADLERILKHAGYIVIGPAGSVAEALVQIVQQEIHGAILNVKLGRELTSPVLDVLAQAGLPFFMVSEHSPVLLPTRHQGRPFIGKPYLDHSVLELLASILPAHARGPDRKPA